MKNRSYINKNNKIKQSLVLGRLWVVGAIFFQIAFLGILFIGFSNSYALVYVINIILVFSAVLFVLNSNINPSYKIAWIIPIMAFPIFGGITYFLFGRNKINKKISKDMLYHERQGRKYLREQLKTSQDVLNKEMFEQMADAAVQSKYISTYAGYPAYKDCISEYLPIGEDKFKRLAEELEKAEHYIFMEYFIIEEGIMWNKILDILQTKVKEGVDVRIIYDDFGCFFTLPFKYNRTLENMGIKCCVFNPLSPVLSFKFDNRDHRKITVIDGYTGFTGGVNLADEYINEYEKFGHWKDSAILIKGEAVKNMTAMFLSMWNYLKGTDESVQKFYFMNIEPEYDSVNNKGYIQPFADSPLDTEPVGETVYLNLIYKAKKTVYITTPYLIIANEMVTALCSAAKGGVDVRIITPYKWDKKLVHLVTQTYYKVFLESGVKIYEYTPGFMHAKTFVVDDIFGVVGTINMDYRSLFLHFENAVWLYGTDSVCQIKEDFIKTLKVCKQITSEQIKSLRWYKKISGYILKVFSPFM